MKNTIKRSHTPKEKIAIEFPGVKLKINREGLTLETLEEMIFEISRGIGQKAFENAVEGYDAQLVKERVRGVLKNIGKKVKSLQTRVGEIKYRRTLFKDKTTGKPRYLLDEALKVGRSQRMSLKMTQIFGALASVEAYRGVAKQISQLLGIRYSHEAIRQNVIKEGQRIEEQEEKAAKKVKALDYEMPKKIPEVLYTETDATYIRRQSKGKKDTKKKHFEVKIGLNYTGKESRYEKGQKKSKKLVNKRIFTGIKQGRREFLEHLSYLTEREYGLSAVEKSYFGGDGDTWIRRGQKDYFPRAKYLLCLYHLFRRLREALPGKKEKHREIKEFIEKNNIDAVLVALEKELNKTEDEKEREIISEFCRYVRNNRAGIEASIRIRRDNGEESAGAVEPNIDKTIAHRFKKRGMSWSENGASALLKIRQVIFNDEWDDWWYENRDKKIEIKAIFKQPLSATVFKKQEIMPYVEATLPCFRGPDQTKPWVEALRMLSKADLLKEKGVAAI